MSLILCQKNSVYTVRGWIRTTDVTITAVSNTVVPTIIFGDTFLSLNLRDLMFLSITILSLVF